MTLDSRVQQCPYQQHCASSDYGDDCIPTDYLDCHLYHTNHYRATAYVLTKRPRNGLGLFRIPSTPTYTFTPPGIKTKHTP
jgi:hypothetical protein